MSLALILFLLMSHLNVGNATVMPKPGARPTTPPDSVTNRLQLLARDSLLAFLRAGNRAHLCPMPVARPDSARPGAIIVVPTDPKRTVPMPTVRPSCVNPLFVAGSKLHVRQDMAVRH